MDRSQFERDLRDLRGAAETELRRLDVEREQVGRLIAFADEYLAGGHARSPKPAKRAARRKKPISVLETIRDRPGVRASMLASVTGQPFDRVADDLAALEQKGEVRREGLGWRLV